MLTADRPTTSLPGSTGAPNPRAERLDRTFGRDQLFNVTGLSLQPIFGLCKLLWLKEKLAVGVTEPGTMLNSLGTAEAIFLPLEHPLTDPKVGHQGYTQGAHVAGQYYVFGGQYTSGASVEWFRSALGNRASYETLIAEAEKVPPGSLGVFFCHTCASQIHPTTIPPQGALSSASAPTSNAATSFGRC
jgi:sugar (pentulose or hexulose) kinase